jgi:predicted dienelactone hydrolase
MWLNLGMRTSPAVALVLVVALVCLACSSDDPATHPDAAGAADATPGADAAAGADAAFPDAGPVGPFAVGVTTRTWVDSTRPTPQNGSEPAKASRTLATEVWYPAAGDPGATSAQRDAALAPGGPYPLVLFVHGSGSNRVAYSYLTTALAHAGFVVAAASFPLTEMFTPGGSSDLHVSDQVGDLSFLADSLAAAAADPADALHGAVDGLHYAVVGHSTGGAVATLAAYAGDDELVHHDPRVAAIVPLSGDACMFAPGFFARRSVPVFVIAASNDLFVRPANSGQYQFDHSAEPRLYARLVGGQHVYFTDIPLPDAILGPVPTAPDSPLAVTLQAYGDASACLPEPAAGMDAAMAFDTQHALTIQLVSAYLNAELRHDRAALDAAIAAHDPAVVFAP